MLGDVISEGQGKVTGYRVLSTEGQEPKVEVSFKSATRLLDVDTNEMGTYWSVVRADGTMYGEGQGVIMGREGELVTWVGQGAGRFNAGGGVSWRGAIYLRTASQKLARLNGIAAVFEFDTDASDNTKAKVWEWK
jgi:hypothetical protein